MKGVGYTYPPPPTRPLRGSIRFLLECLLVLFIFNSVSWEIYTQAHKKRSGGQEINLTESREKENNKDNIHKILTFIIDRRNSQTYCGVPF